MAETETGKLAKKLEIDFSKLSVNEIDEIIAKAEEEKKSRKADAIAKLKAEFEGKLNQLNLTLGEIFPVSSGSGKTNKGKASPKADNLETPEKGVTYQNPLNAAERWTAGAKKGRAPAWVTELRTKGELAKHKADV